MERPPPRARAIRRDGVDVKMFLLAEAVGCAVAGPKVPDGYYHLDRMIEGAARRPADARPAWMPGLTTASGPIQVAVRRAAPQSLAQNWAICITQSSQTHQQLKAHSRRSVIVRTNNNIPLVTLRNREER